MVMDRVGLRWHFWSASVLPVPAPFWFLLAEDRRMAENNTTGSVCPMIRAFNNAKQVLEMHWNLIPFLVDKNIGARSAREEQDSTSQARQSRTPGGPKTLGDTHIKPKKANMPSTSRQIHKKSILDVERTLPEQID